jgi:E3 ubiquitin-protein ligase HERC3
VKIVNVALILSLGFSFTACKSGTSPLLQVATKANSAPVATDKIISTLEDTAISTNLPAYDIDGNAITFTIVSNGTKGRAIFSDPSNGIFVYTPLPNVNGADVFTYRVNDGVHFSNVASVQVNIVAVNDSPGAMNVSVATLEDTPVSGTLGSVDIDSTALTYSIETNGAKGVATVTDVARGTFTYAPNLNTNGTDSFTFRVNDGSLESNLGTVSVTITPVNDAPVAQNGTLNTIQNVEATGTLVATDVDSPTLVFSIVAPATKGTVSITNAATGAYRYTPNLNANGTDTFTFKANDGALDSAVATVTVTIRPVPVAQNVAVSTVEGVPAFGNLVATDDAPVPFIYRLVKDSNTLGGLATLNPSTGAFSWTPSAGVGNDTFTYEACDATNLCSNVATVTVTVKPKLVSVVAGAFHNCGLNSLGKVSCWGNNANGQLGLEDTVNRGDQANQMGANLPYVNLSSNRTVRALSLGGAHSCALFDNGRVKCWGWNGSGQLGTGDAADRGGKTGEMGDNLPFVDLGTNRTVRSLSAGYNHTCAVLDNDRIKCWGDNEVGKLGLGDGVNRGAKNTDMGDQLPYVDIGTGRTAKRVVAGVNATCAILDNDQMKCWGGIASGDSITHGGQPDYMGDRLPEFDFGSNRSVVSLSVGVSMGCALLDNQKVKCWGSNSFGELGLGDTVSRGYGSETTGDNLPYVDFGGTHTVKQVVSGANHHNCAVLDDDSLKCWGYNRDDGVLGLGDIVNRGDKNNSMGENLPTVNLGTGRSVMGVTAGYNHTCAMLDNRQVKCWGKNLYGELGLGDTDTRGLLTKDMGDNLPNVGVYH